MRATTACARSIAGGHFSLASARSTPTTYSSSGTSFTTAKPSPLRTISSGDGYSDDGTDDARAPGAGRARAQLDHVDVVAAQLGHARAVHHGHADRVLGRGRRDERHQRDHRHERRALGRPHRRPKSQNSRVSSSDSPMEVASGK